MNSLVNSNLQLSNGMPASSLNLAKSVSLARRVQTKTLQYVTATLAVAACAFVCFLGGAWISQDDAIMLFFAITYLLAYRMTLGPVIWAGILSVLCFDFYIAPPAFQLLWTHALTFGVLFPAVILTSYRTSKLELYASNLEGRVEERTKELELSNRKLSEEAEKQRITEDKLRRTVEELGRSNAMLQQFARIASHDLQEPLRVLQGYVGLLNSRYKGRLDQKGDEFLNYISDATLRMEKLVAGILNHASVSNATKKFEVVNVSTALDDACANLQQRIQETGAVITRSPLPTLFANRALITQLFQNLIGNSLKFQKVGEIPRIHITATQFEHGWKFIVEDNGIGIEPEYKERIFGMFKRLHSSQEYPGHGLGLAICKAIVDQHSGTIWVESESGRGSRFCFSIPSKA